MPKVRPLRKSGQDWVSCDNKFLFYRRKNRWFVESAVFAARGMAYTPVRTLRQAVEQMENLTTQIKVKPLWRSSGKFWFCSSYHFILHKHKMGWQLILNPERYPLLPPFADDVHIPQAAHNVMSCSYLYPLAIWASSHGLDRHYKTRRELLERLEAAVEVDAPDELIEQLQLLRRV